jgi:2-polyprenyl-3-methyl-5-hydroxy-6-metoxy-1,4-benzoquinol methylase
MESTINPDLVKLASFNVFSKLEGAVTAGMIHLGDRLGLYSSLASSPHPVTSNELATHTGLHERWVREWLSNQVAAKIINVVDISVADPRFFITPESALVLATPESPAFGMGMFHRLPQTMAALEAMPEAFATGVGHDYDSHGPEGAVGIERSFEPWMQNFLIPVVIPSLEGVNDQLNEGAKVADIGCGAGSAALLIGSTFPNSVVHGFDISHYALDRANEKKSASGVSNVTFSDPRENPISTDHSYDLVCTFDCIHDMTHPQEMMETIRGAIKDTGTWLLVDIKAADTLEQNIAKNPMASMLYGISVLSCMSSAMSAPDGAGLGTLGLSASKAEEMARAAGFTKFRRLDVEHNVNAFYEVRP